MFFKRRLIELAALLLAAMIWWPLMHLFWRPSNLLESDELDPIAVPMAISLEAVWEDVSVEADGIEPMRQVNPEWDFMGRTFFILGEANLALRMPERKAECLAAIDALIGDTLTMGFLVLGALGGKGCIQVLTGIQPFDSGQVLLGGLYLGAYMALVLVSPVCVLAAGMIAVWDYWRNCR